MEGNRWDALDFRLFRVNYFLCFVAFGGFKSRSQVPALVNQFLEGDLPIEHYITHKVANVISHMNFT